MWWVLYSNMSRDQQSTTFKKCSWKREYFHRDADGRLAQVTECGDGFIYRSPAVYRVAPNTAKPEEGKPRPAKFVELPGEWLAVPAGAVPCSADDYDAALARAIKAEKADPLLAMQFKNRKAAVELGPAAARVESTRVVQTDAPVLRVSSVDLLADYTVLDFEFFYPGGGAAPVPIELAAIRYTNGQPVGQMQQFIALPAGQYVPSRISQHTGITSGMLKGAPSVRRVLNEFRELIGASALVAHNASADQPVLEKTRTALGATTPLANPWLCTMRGAEALLPQQPSHALGPLCNALGIAAHGAHRALRDVEMCQAVLLHLRGLEGFRVELLQKQAAKPKAKATGKKAPATAHPTLFAA